MSLNFDLSAVKTRLGDRWDEITTSPETRHLPYGHQQWHPVTDTLIWMTMAVDLGGITEDNVGEWCFRVGLINKLAGAANLRGSRGSYTLTRKDIENHVGMRTNVTTRTRASWLARIFKPGTIDSRNASLADTEAAVDIINRDMAKWMADEEAKNKAAGIAAEASDA